MAHRSNKELHMNHVNISAIYGTCAIGERRQYNYLVHRDIIVFVFTAIHVI